MAILRGHGGNCCGMRHYSGWDRNQTQESLKRAVKALNGQCRTRGRLIEAVLTDKQLRDNPDWLVWLKESNFKLVQRFCNANTGANCNVFHFHPNPKPIDDLPFDWSNNE